MAAPTKTTKNTKLPTVSKIAWCTAAGKNMATKIYTGEAGAFTRMVCFKQDSKTYPFQIQYAVRSRYTVANSKKKGATWTGWTKWKNAVPVSGIPFNGTESDYPVDRWMKANKGINKNGTYQTFISFTDYQIPDDYDAREFIFRIRTINKSKAKHGNWTTTTLQVFRRAHVVDERLLTAADGGLKVKYNYAWDRPAEIQINSIQDSGGRELLKKAYTAALRRTALSNVSVPPYREGYKGGVFDIPLDKLKRKINADEGLTVDFRFVTVDGAQTQFVKERAVVEPRRDIGMTVTRNYDEAVGMLRINCKNADVTALHSIGCNITYTYNGKVYSLAPFAQKLDLTKNGTSYFYFYPPIGIPLTYQVKEEDIYDNKDVEPEQTLTIEGKGYRLNYITNVNRSALVWGEPSYEINTAPQVETSLPYGRTSNIIFYGKGNTKTITLSGTIVDRDGLYGGKWAKRLAWENVSNNQGLYIFRTNKGELYKVGLTSVNIQHQDKDLYQVSVQMVEVV